MDKCRGLTIETERGKAVDWLDFNIGELIRLIDKLPKNELSRTHCLQYIDPWADTVFNRVQKKVFAQELEALRLSLIHI